MCLAVPLRIISIDDKDGVAGYDGITRRIRLDFIKNPKVGEYVIVHAGFAIEKLSEREARENLEAIREVSNADKE